MALGPRPTAPVASLTACVLACLLAAGSAPAFALQADTVGLATISPGTPDYLKALDSNFVGEYEGLKTLEARSRPLVVIGATDEFHVYRYGNLSETVPVDTALYHAMKTYLHATLGLFGTCRSWAVRSARGQPALDAAGKQASLESYKEAADAAVELAGSDPVLSDEQKEAVLEILKEYSTLLDAAAAAGYDASACLEGMRAQKDAVMRLVNETGDYHWDALQDAIAKVKEGASEEEWANVLVAVPTGATVQNMNIEYGAWLQALGDDAASRQVFTAIGVFDDDGVLAALATNVTDGELSRDFFGSPTRMWRDLFADVAAQHVGRVYDGF